jgi:hypothetical protein
MMTDYYLVLDPGDTTGVALFGAKGTLLSSNQIDGIAEVGYYLEQMLRVDKHACIRCLYESYKVFPWVKQGGSDVPAAQVIGIIKYLCSKYGVPYEEIDPKFKRIGYAWSGKKPPSNHAISHGPDAEALGEYWLRKNKVKGMDDD